MPPQKDNQYATVYSTEHGKMCPKCSKPISRCKCKLKKSSPIKDGIIRVSRETKGRKGKGMTLVSGASVTLDELKQLAKHLKQKCATGGSVKDGVIEIQGDHRDLVVEELIKLGHKAKRVGG